MGACKRWRCGRWVDEGESDGTPTCCDRDDGCWPTLEKKGQRSSVVMVSLARWVLHFYAFDAVIDEEDTGIVLISSSPSFWASSWSSPMAAMAVGLGEGDGAPKLVLRWCTANRVPAMCNLVFRP
ncbi:hypothetical protein ACLOJK_034913 [Asimina triloba]